YALGSLSSGLAMATGALNVSYSDSEVPYTRRVRQLLSASILVGFAVAAGAVAAIHPAVGVTITCIWAFAAGMLAALSQPVADMGLISLVTMLVYAATPLRPSSAVLAGLIAFCGGLIQTALALAPWPLRRYVPERAALSDFFAGISRSA